MRYVRYRVQILGSFSHRGFGFSCMHMAYQNNVTGSLFYESATSAILELTGLEQDILRVMVHCKKADFVSDINILNIINTEHKSTDFIMLNRIE